MKKSLSIRTQLCPSCKVEICRDTNAAVTILYKGLNILGVERNKHNSTSGHEGCTPEGGKAGEKITATADEKLDIVSEPL